MTVWYCKIPIMPAPKQRPRFTRTGRTYTPYKTVLRERFIRDHLATLTPPHFEGAVKVELIMWFQRPRTNRNRLHVVKPDLDNCTKLILDALNGIVWQDDCQVCRICATKTYCDERVVDPCVEVRVTELLTHDDNTMKGDRNGRVKNQKNEGTEERRDTLQRRRTIRPSKVTEQKTPRN